MSSTELTPIQPTPYAHVAVCPGCEIPSLTMDLCRDSAAMQCPRCGTFFGPEHISMYELVDNDE